MRAISQSQINLYRKCPHAYELHYRYNMEPMFYDSSVLYVGKSVHEAIDNYYKHCYNSNNSAGNILSYAYGYIREHWDTSLPAEYLKKTHLCLCNFAEFEAGNNHALATKPITEVKIVANDLLGIVDYIDLNNQKAIDFKTNNSASLSYEYKLQAVMYKHLIKEQFNIELKKFGFAFLFPNEYLEVHLGNPKLKDIEQDLFNYKEQIKNSWSDGEFPKNPKTQSTCKYCEYRYYCDGGVE